MQDEIHLSGNRVLAHCMWYKAEAGQNWVQSPKPLDQGKQAA